MSAIEDYCIRHTSKVGGPLNDIYRSGRTDRTGDKQYLGKPVSLIDGATQLAVEIQASENSVAPKFLPLFTVGTEHAATLVGLLKVTHPFKGVQATIVCSEPFAAPRNGGTLTTIGVAFGYGFYGGGVLANADGKLFLPVTHIHLSPHTVLWGNALLSTQNIPYFHVIDKYKKAGDFCPRPVLVHVVQLILFYASSSTLS